MKRLSIGIALLLLLLPLSACGPAGDVPGDESLAGTYTGYSWRGEAGGVAFEDADQYIETVLELDEDGTILDAEINFYVMQDGEEVARNNAEADVEVNFGIDPTPAVPGDNYEPGTSMFTIDTVDMMSFYAVAVDSDGTTAVALVDPVIRYQHEMKFAPDFDFDRPMSDLTIGSGLAVPTIRTSGSGLMRPDTWDEIADRTFLDIDIWSHVITDRGVLSNIDSDSTVGEFLQALGVEFADGRPQEMAVQDGRFGLGGWEGNYEAIADYLVGKNANEVTSLVDWSIERFANAVNEDNHFGIDVASGATRTIQNSLDGIAGATVRISRESTSYQRALVEAGIIAEEDVIVGRF